MRNFRWDNWRKKKFQDLCRHFGLSEEGAKLSGATLVTFDELEPLQASTSSLPLSPLSMYALHNGGLVTTSQEP